MPEFTFKGYDEQGGSVSGTIEADSLDSAGDKLASKGLIPTHVAEKGPDAISDFFAKLKQGLSKVPAEDLILFTKQFRTMLNAGVPILSVFETLENQCQEPLLKKAMATIQKDVRDGVSLYDSFSKHPSIFNNLYCGMVQAGETSGTLPAVLDRLTYLIEHENKIRMDIKSATQYPKMVVGALFVAFLVLLNVVIPKFITIFERAGLELPLPTKICMIMYNFMSDYWLFLIMGGLGGIVLLNYYVSTKQGELAKDKFLLSLPIMGPLFQKAAMSRFTSVFSILQSSGVPVLTSLEIVSKTIGNAAISYEFAKIKEKMEAGHGISKPLKAAQYFTPMVIDMVTIGEETGTLDNMLKETSMHYDEEVGFAVRRLSESLNPILMVGLTVVVGFFAFAIFLPMWDLTKMVK